MKRTIAWSKRAAWRKETIAKLIKLCEEGPFLSEVKSVQVEWEKETEHFAGFETVH